MRTLDEQRADTDSWMGKRARDWKLLRRLVSMIVAYFTVGARIRRRYAESERRGSIYWLDSE